MQVCNGHCDVQVLSHLYPSNVACCGTRTTTTVVCMRSKLWWRGDLNSGLSSLTVVTCGSSGLSGEGGSWGGFCHCGSSHGSCEYDVVCTLAPLVSTVFVLFPGGLLVLFSTVFLFAPFLCRGTPNESRTVFLLHRFCVMAVCFAGSEQLEGCQLICHEPAWECVCVWVCVCVYVCLHAWIFVVWACMFCRQ